VLRIGFLPSDFNPMILMLGEAEDCRALGGVLRQFARDGTDIAFRELGFCRLVGADLTLTASTEPACLHRQDDAVFTWRVPTDMAAELAGRLDDLGAPERLAGSEELACGTEDGIAVRVSRGEYTDDFLAD